MIYVTHSRSVSEATAHSCRFGKALVIWWGGGKHVLLAQNLCGGLLESNYKYTDEPLPVCIAKERESLRLWYNIPPWGFPVARQRVKQDSWHNGLSRLIMRSSYTLTGHYMMVHQLTRSIGPVCPESSRISFPLLSFTYSLQKGVKASFYILPTLRYQWCIAFYPNITMTSFSKGWRQGICHKIQGSLQILDVTNTKF